MSVWQLVKLTIFLIKCTRHLQFRKSTKFVKFKCCPNNFCHLGSLASTMLLYFTFGPTRAAKFHNKIECFLQNKFEVVYTHSSERLMSNEIQNLALTIFLLPEDPGLSRVDSTSHSENKNIGHYPMTPNLGYTSDRHVPTQLNFIRVLCSSSRGCFWIPNLALTLVYSFSTIFILDVVFFFVNIRNFPTLYVSGTRLLDNEYNLQGATVAKIHCENEPCFCSLDLKGWKSYDFGYGRLTSIE